MLQTQETAVTTAQPLLKLVNVSKQYPGVLALDSINFELRAGEVHILFGENGAGKSTMISIIAGAVSPTSGTMLFKGQPKQFHPVHNARELGISAVFQEFSLIPQLTVSENLTLGAETTKMGLLNKKAMQQQSKSALAELNFNVPIDKQVRFLSRAEQQMVEIAAAFRSKMSVLVLDEPTASLTERETQNLFKLIEQAKSEGVGIIYITHRMSEIKRIGDRITVLRDGKYVATVDADSTTEDHLLELMTGRVIDQIFPRIQFAPTETILEAKKLTTVDSSVNNVSFHVKQGEIVGFAGLVGCGKSRAARACFGIEPIGSGQVLFDGTATTRFGLKQMLDRGMFYVPPDRHKEGLVMIRHVRENISLAALSLRRFSRSLFLKRKDERTVTNELAKRLNLQPFDIEKRVYQFSGGNQQKVLLSKTLTRDVKLFIFDEPTIGVDVGTRVAIYQFMAELCEAGAAVLLVSSDLPEVLHLTHRVYVFHRGRVRAELRGRDITEENILGHFFGEDENDAVKKRNLLEIDVNEHSAEE